MYDAYAFCGANLNSSTLMQNNIRTNRLYGYVWHRNVEGFVDFCVPHHPYVGHHQGAQVSRVT